MMGRILLVASSDSSGGTGIPADIKTVTALKGYAMSAITAITAQDTVAVRGVHAIPPEFIALQMRAALSDVGADAIKIGLVLTAPVVDAIADVLQTDAAGVPFVLDPIFAATGGGPKLDENAHLTLTRRLAFVAALMTPNLDEAAILCGEERIHSLDEQKQAAEMMRTLGAPAVLVTGGAGEEDLVHDVLASSDGIEVFTSPRIATTQTRGIGSTLATAIATGLAQGMDLRAAIERARAYVRRAVATAPGYGQGRGPINHGVTVAPFTGT